MLIDTLIAVIIALDPITTLAIAARSDQIRHSHDQFSASHLYKEYIGKSFVIDLPVKGPQGVGYANYDDEELHIGVDTHITVIDDDAPQDKSLNSVIKPMRSLYVKTLSSSHGSYVGQNAYGARVGVQSSKKTQVAILIVGGPNPDIGFNLVDKLPPEQARKISKSAHLIIYGKVAMLPSGRVNGCQDLRYQPTIDAPYDDEQTICYVAADVSRVVLSANGATLKEWVP